MQLIPGHDLTETQRAAVLAAFVHRHTAEHPSPAAYAPGRAPAPTVTDAQWLDARSFWVTRHGQLSATRGCWVHEPVEPPTTSELADALRAITDAYATLLFSDYSGPGEDRGAADPLVQHARTLLARIDGPEAR